MKSHKMSLPDHHTSILKEAVLFDTLKIVALPLEFMAMDAGDLQFLRSYLQTEFGALRRELSEISQRLPHKAHEPMSKDVFERRVSNVVMKLERSDSQSLSPNPITNTRRISFNGLSPRPPLSTQPTIEVKTPETHHFDSNEVESVRDEDEEDEDAVQVTHVGDSFPDLVVDEVSMPSLPGSMPDKGSLAKTPSKRFAQSSVASQKWAESMESSQQKLNIFEHKVEKGDAFGRGMGLVTTAQDKAKTTTFKSTFHAKCHKLVTSSNFELLTIFLISSSALQIGLSTNWMAENLVGDTSEVHRVIEVVYCIIFTVELTLRLVAYRLEFFTQAGPEETGDTGIHTGSI